jgi:hypothetical protein
MNAATSYYYKVTLPIIDTGVSNFTFSARVENSTFTFNFQFFNNVWNVFTFFPSGEIREAQVYPNVMAWTGFADYSLAFITSLPIVGLNDLGSISMYMVSWRV